MSHNCFSLNEGHVLPKGKARLVYILVNILSIAKWRFGSLQTILSRMKLPNTGRFLVIFQNETLVESEGGKKEKHLDFLQLNETIKMTRELQLLSANYKIFS